MKVRYVIVLIQGIALLLAIALLVLKYRDVQKFKTRSKYSGSRWLLWFNSIQIMGTDSPSRRNFMQTQNKLSTIMWICVILLVLSILASTYL